MHILKFPWLYVVSPCWVGFSRDLLGFSRLFRFFPGKTGKKVERFFPANPADDSDGLSDNVKQRYKKKMK